MEIVKMEQGHLSDLARLERLCFSRPWSAQALAQELDQPGAVFLVAQEGGVVLGYAGAHVVLDECYLTNVAVFPAARRRGVATALLAALEKEARRRGGAFLSLEARASNWQAISLYTKAGFQREGRRKNFYADPTEDGLIMTKRF